MSNDFSINQLNICYPKQNTVDEIENLTKLVQRTYKRCFVGEDAEQSAISMLTKIEKVLNVMY